MLMRNLTPFWKRRRRGHFCARPLPRHCRAASSVARIETRRVGSVSLAVIALRGFEVSPQCHHHQEAAGDWGKGSRGRTSVTLTFSLMPRKVASSGDDGRWRPGEQQRITALPD
ncbi:hypothetical protein KIL84_022187 [Mauremys mutica]|uniref:Uncharacterized protein n=1 Tax=Mauremys mutica TaxID=74926 RepID=A0A9D4ATH6_9SAUR|nr:hypothetical protein KIL84_022187 [Mauremys mutica]